MIQNALIAVIAMFAVLLGVQTLRLSNEQAAHAKTVAACATAKQDAAEKLATETAKARKTEQQLQIKINQDRRQADEAIEALTRQRNALRAERLRNNAANAAKLPAPSESAGAAQAGPDPDGTELSGSTGSAEEDEALRADIIRIELKSCYSAYERATKVLSHARD
ncbi:MAG: hypothetical protein HEQ39_10070 [Rhizobacter sp.]